MFVPPTCVTARNADAVTVRQCIVDAIAISGGTGHRVEANVVAGGNVVLDGTTKSVVTGNFQHGLRWGVGIEISGGADVIVDHNECHDDLCAIRIVGSGNARVERNRIETRWFGVHVRDGTGATVRRNRIVHTDPGVSVEGGRDHLVERNLVERCDTGVLLERDATATRVSENWLHGCRVGILAWSDRGSILTGNAVSEPRDHAVVANTAIDLAGNDLGEGSVFIGARPSLTASSEVRPPVAAAYAAPDRGRDRGGQAWSSSRWPCGAPRARPRTTFARRSSMTGRSPRSRSRVSSISR